MSGYIFNKPEDIKTIILFIIDNYGAPIDNGIVTDIFMSHEFVDFFTMQQYLDQLIESGLIAEYSDNHSHKYTITDIGREAISGFCPSIPVTVRKKILESIKKYKLSIENGKLVTAIYVKHNDLEHIAHLTINEGGAPLFDLQINCGSQEAAMKVCVKFKENPEKVYQNIFDILS